MGIIKLIFGLIIITSISVISCILISKDVRNKFKEYLNKYALVIVDIIIVVIFSCVLIDIPLSGHTISMSLTINNKSRSFVITSFFNRKNKLYKLIKNRSVKDKNRHKYDTEYNDINKDIRELKRNTLVHKQYINLINTIPKKNQKNIISDAITNSFCVLLVLYIILIIGYIIINIIRPLHKLHKLKIYPIISGFIFKVLDKIISQLLLLITMYPIILGFVPLAFNNELLGINLILFIPPLIYILLESQAVLFIYKYQRRYSKLLLLYNK